MWLFKITVKHEYSRRVPSEGMRNYVIYHTVGRKIAFFCANCVVYGYLSRGTDSFFHSFDSFIIHSFGMNSNWLRG